MSKTLEEIAKELQNNKKKSQLIYAFNGTGKTQLSQQFKKLFNSPEIIPVPKHNLDERTRIKYEVIYFSAFTEDLFYWNNDEENNENLKLMIQPNSFTNWIFEFLNEQGEDQNITSHFQHFTKSKITPIIDSDLSSISFSIAKGDDEGVKNIKISKGEESNYIWSVFYTLFEQIVSVINEKDVNEKATDEFDNLKCIFIDDPVSSLDENHLIELAVKLANLIKSCNASVNFIITTHNILFYNVLYNELKKPDAYLLKRNQDNTYELIAKEGDSNSSFSYHLLLRQQLSEAVSSNTLQKYHFIFLRNLYEKTASFLGYKGWRTILPPEYDDKRNDYAWRTVQLYSHSSVSYDMMNDLDKNEDELARELFNNLERIYKFFG